MTLAIFGFGVFVFFISVYGAVVAGGLRLTADQLNEEPELADRAGLESQPENVPISARDITSKEF